MNLIEAIREENYSIVHDFIASTDNLNIGLDQHQNTALIYASIHGKTEIVKYLLDAGAEVDRQVLGETALMYASWHNQSNIIKILIEAGANLELKSKESLTALQQGLIRNSVEAVQILIEAGANLNVWDERGLGVFSLAIQSNGKVEIIESLLRTGVDINERDCSGLGRTPLETAVGFAKLDIVCLLLKSGADIGIDHSELLSYAIESGNAEILKTLMQAGADITTIKPSSNGMTGLMWATLRGNTEIVELLLQVGVDIEAKDCQGKTALTIAEAQGKQDILNMLHQALERQ